VCESRSDGKGKEKNGVSYQELISQFSIFLGTSCYECGKQQQCSRLKVLSVGLERKLSEVDFDGKGKRKRVAATNQ
jgi:hypothetical protein